MPNVSMVPVAILCGGKGTRIESVAAGLPKALIPVAGEPFLAHQLHWIHDEGVRKVVLLTGYRGDAIRDFVGDGSAFGLEVRCVDDGDSPRGTAGAIQHALPLLGETFLTIYGDSLVKAPLAEVHASLASPYRGVMTVFENHDRWLPSNVRIDGDRLSAYEKGAPLGSMTHIDYGVNAFVAGAFAEVAGDRPSDLAEIHRTLISRGELRAFPVLERWHEIGSPEALEETEQFVRSRPGR